MSNEKIMVRLMVQEIRYLNETIGILFILVYPFVLHYICIIYLYTHFVYRRNIYLHRHIGINK